MGDLGGVIVSLSVSESVLGNALELPLVAITWVGGVLRVSGLTAEVSGALVIVKSGVCDVEHRWDYGHTRKGQNVETKGRGREV